MFTTDTYGFPTLLPSRYPGLASQKLPIWQRLGSEDLGHKRGYHDTITCADIIEAKDLAWHPVKSDLYYTAIGDKAKDPSIDGSRYCTSTKAISILRSDTGVELGSTSPSYSLIEHLGFLKVLEQFVESHQLKISNAFCLGGGEQVIFVLQLPGIDIIADDDVSFRYLFLQFDHVGRMQLRIVPTSQRINCANQAPLILRMSGSTVPAHLHWSIRHIGDTVQKVKNVARTLAALTPVFDQNAEILKSLATAQVSVNTEFDSYIEEVFPLPIESPGDPIHLAQPRVNRVKEVRRTIRRYFLEDSRQTGYSTKHTWYSAFNSVSQWLDHNRAYRGSTRIASNENRFKSNTFGKGQATKQFALSKACDYAALN